MKIFSSTLSETHASGKAVFADYLELIKARLTSLVLMTTLVGFYIGSNGKVDLWVLFSTMLGTAMVASGAAALNQFMEREVDAKMTRTENRPIPAGRIQPDEALLFGVLVSVAGILYLALSVNILTSLLSVITLISYLFVYTPLKRVTHLNTLIGAVPGGLPPMMGWTAARDVVTEEAWTLFGILFLWQMPHFFAIAWMYRKDYERGGFQMLPVIDPEGWRTASQSVLYSFALIPISLFPTFLKMTGMLYFWGALFLGSGYVYFAFRFLIQKSESRAKRLFLMSISYLPLLLLLMVADKLR